MRRPARHARLLLVSARLLLLLLLYPTRPAIRAPFSMPDLVQSPNVAKDRCRSDLLVAAELMERMVWRAVAGAGSGQWAAAAVSVDEIAVQLCALAYLLD